MQDPDRPEKEKKRLEKLGSLNILDTLPEQEYDDIVALASHLCQTPIALVSFVDDRRQWFKANIGLAANETPRDVAFCAHAISQEQPVFQIENAQEDPRFVHNPLVTGSPHIRFYAGAPFFAQDGSPLGTVCVIDTVPRQLDPHQADMLERLARQISALLSLRLQRDQLDSQSHEIDRLRRSAEQEFRRSKELLDLALRSGNFGLWDLDVGSGRWTINDREREMLGLSAEEARPERFTWDALVPREELALLDRALQAHLAGQTPYYECEHRMRHKLGHWIWVHTRAFVAERSGGHPKRIVGTHQEVTKERAERSALDEANDVLHRTNALAKVGGWTYDLRSHAVSWTDEVYRIHELQIGDEVGLSSAINYYTETSRLRVEKAMAECVSTGKPWDLELQMVTAKGRAIWVRAQGAASLKNGHAEKLVGAFQDITDRKISELALLALNQKLERLSLTDGLTGLGNRRLFDEALQSEFHRAVRNQASIALIMMDVDHFKVFNDRFGHVAGDVCLKRVGLALSLIISRPGDLVARFGGEEFVVLLPNTDAAGALIVARRCFDAIAAEKIDRSLGGDPPSWVSVSIGVAAFAPTPNDAPTSLIDAADTVLYKAKRDGRSRIYVSEELAAARQKS